MKKKIFILISALVLSLGCLLLTGCFDAGKRVDEYFDDGYILIPTAERFVECFLEDKTIPGYDAPKPGEAMPLDYELEMSVISARGGIKGYRLTADLDFTGIDISALNGQYTYAKGGKDLIGDKDGNVKGFVYKLDGNNHEMRNITMDGDFASVFGTLSYGAEISNLTIADSTFTGGKYIGAFLSYIDLDNVDGKITNCTVRNCKIGTASSEYVGGFVGYMENSRAGSASDGRAGLILDNINVLQSEIKGSINVGGVIGAYHATKDSWAKAEISKLYNTQSSVTGYNIIGEDANVGGIIGRLTTYNTTVTVKDCAVSFAEIRGNLYRVGGIVGNIYFKPNHWSNPASNNKVFISGCYGTGATVVGNKYVGGIVGQVGDQFAEI
jgi:hypothetical protein